MHSVLYVRVHVHVYTCTIYNVCVCEYCGSFTYSLAVLNMLAVNPPFTRKTESKLNTPNLVERMWTLIWWVWPHSCDNTGMNISRDVQCQTRAQIANS